MNEKPGMQLLGDRGARRRRPGAPAPACAGRPWRGTPRGSARCGRRRRRWRRTSRRAAGSWRRGLPLGVEERHLRGARRHGRVVVRQRELEVQLGAGRGEVGPDPGHADVPLQDRRVHEAGAVADLACGRRRRASTRTAAGVSHIGGSSPTVAVQPVPVGPVDDDARRSPSARCRRAARAGSPSLPTKRRSPSRTPRSIQPQPSSLGVTRSASLKASRLSCHSMSISGSPASMRSTISASSPNGRMPCAPPGLEHGVEHVDAPGRRAR